MLHTAVVPVNGKPVLQLFGISQRLLVLRVDITQEIPRGACPLGHGVCFALRSLAALGAFAVYEAIDLCKWAFAALTRLKVVDLRKLQMKLIIRDGNHSAMLAVDDRDRLSPVSLTVERPILHLVLHAHLSDSLLLKMLQHTCNGILFIGKSVKEIRVDHLTVARVSRLGNVSALDDLNDINAEFLCKCIVALVVCRNCHDRACTVAHHHVIRDVDRNFLARNGIDRGQSLNTHACFLLDELSTLKLGLLCACFLVCIQCVDVRDLISVLLNDGMLGCDDHEGHAEQRVASGGIDTKLILALLEREIHKRTRGFADPVDLLLGDIGKIIYLVKPLQQLVCVLRDAKIPNGFGLLDDIALTNIALAALRILVGKHHLTARAIIDQSGITEYQSVFIHFEEDPLRPAVIVLLGGIHHAVPIKGEPHAAKL